jgi:hypothetical protein
VNAQVLRTAWFRFRATFHQRRGGYLAIVLLLGSVGGVALGALAGARRTSSSYPTYLASTNPTTVQLFTAFLNPQLGFTHGYYPASARRLAGVRYVQSVATVVGFDANIDQLNGAHLRVGPGDKPPSLEGSTGTEYWTQDKITLVSGHLPDLADADQAVINAQAATELDLHVGSVFTVTLNSDAQLLSSANNPPPFASQRLRIVGLVVFPQDVVNDDYDAKGTAEVLMTPAATRRLDGCCATYSYSALRLDGGDRHLAAAEAQITSFIPAKLLATVGFRSGAPQIALADQAIRPMAVALAVFGGLAALAVLVVVGQIIGRQRRVQAEEIHTLRALGANPAMTTADAALGTAAAVIVGSLLAVGVAVAFSPLFPLGPVHPVYPIGVGFDWTVLGFGFLALVVVLGALSVLLAYRLSPHRADRRSRGSEGPSLLARVTGSSGLPTSAATGIRFALEPGSDAAPVRSAIVGAIVAMLVIVATVTFGASLNGLIARPALYGWNWNYALFSGFAGDEDLPAHLSADLLAGDRYVTAASGAYFSTAKIDGQRGISVIGLNPDALVQPPVLSGTELRTKHQIILGASTLAALHAHIGGTVEVNTGSGPTRLVVAGTATMPAIMGPGMGVGAVIDYRLIPPEIRNAQGNTVPGPQVFFVRTRGGDSEAALRSLELVSVAINEGDSDQPAGGVTPVLRPEVMVNSGSIETIPTALGASLAAGAIAALGITLVASVRRRRRDLAVMKTLGLSGRQLATVVAWQSSTAVVIGTVVGVPVGIVVGRLLWDVFANAIHAVPSPSVPALTVTWIALGAIVVANAVAALPGWIAARTPTALLLRVE